MNLQNLKIIAITILLGICASCVNDHPELTKEQELQILKQQLSKIMSLAQNESCTDATGWSFTYLGSACSNNFTFIIYSRSIDAALFFKEVETFNKADRAFTLKWPSGGTCDMIREPTGVACVDGVPVLTY